MTARAKLEDVASMLGQGVDIAFNGDGRKRVGFVLLVFDFGRGNLAYASNADRKDIIDAMREFIAKHEATTGSLSIKQS